MGPIFQSQSLFLFHGVHVVNWRSSLAVELLLYAPKRPVVDLSVVFLWMMAVGTILCASCWSEFTGSQQSDERYNELSPKVSCSTLYSLSKTFDLKGRLFSQICLDLCHHRELGYAK